MPRSLRTLAAVAVVAVALAVLQSREVGRAFKSLTPEMIRSGAPAPALGVTEADGAPIAETEFQGRPMLVSFWAAWCAPCRLELPEAAAVVERWNAETKPAEHVSMIAVNEGDDPASLSMFLSDPRFKSVRFVFDLKLAAGERWKVAGLPATYLVDRNGAVAMVQTGYSVGFGSRLHDTLKTLSETGAKP